VLLILTPSFSFLSFPFDATSHPTPLIIHVYSS
jgi:hypothetical protein